MKKGLLLLLFLQFFSNANLFAQKSGLDYYDAGIEKFDKALDLMDKPYKYSTSQLIIEDLKAAVPLFKSAGSKISNLKILCNFHIYECYLLIAKESKKHKYIDELYYHDSAVSLWPTKDAIPSYAVTTTTTVNVGGKLFDIHGSRIEDYNEAFYNLRYVEADEKYNDGKFDEALRFATMGSDAEAPHFYRFYCANTAADILHSKQNKHCLAGKFIKIVLEEANNMDTNTNTKLALIGSMLKLKVNLDENCFDKETLGDLANIVIKLGSKWGKDYETGFTLGDKSYEAGYRSLDLMMTLAEKAADTRKTDEKNKWLERIDEYIKENKSKIDWRKLRDFYRRIGEGGRRFSIAEKKVRNYENNVSDHLLIGINPFNIINNQYLIDADFYFGSFGHSIRFNYENGSNSLVLAGSKDSGNAITTLKFKGYQLGYTLKIPLARKFYDLIYLGPEIRYGNRQYLDSILIESKTNKADKSTRNLDAKGNNYEFSLDLGYIRAPKKLFFEIYFGAGYGYKTLTTNLDTAKYEILDYRYASEHWNKGYFFPRGGMRIGWVF